MICPVCGNKTIKKVEDECIGYKGQYKTIKGIISHTCVHCKESFFDPQSEKLLDEEFKKSIKDKGLKSEFEGILKKSNLSPEMEKIAELIRNINNLMLEDE